MTLIRKIWMVSREYGDIAGAGGVKDMVRQLAEQLASWTGCSVNVVIPLYGFLDIDSLPCSLLMDPACPEQPLKLDIDMSEPSGQVVEQARIYHGRLNRVNLYLVDSPRFQQKLGVYTYTAAEERDTWWQKQSSGHHDYFAMNVLLQKATLDLCMALGAEVDVFHCHDGHTAILPGLIRECAGYRTYFRHTGVLTTIHNAGRGYHQEVRDLAYARTITGLPEQVILESLLEDAFDPFLVAGQYGRINTVSEQYAVELKETDEDARTGWLGHDLTLRGFDLQGITNGIDPRLFLMENLEYFQDDECFSPGDSDDDLRGKSRIKERLLKQLALGDRLRDVQCFGTLSSNVDQPLFTSIGRFSEQKGVDILIDALRKFHQSHPEAQSLVLGSGDPVLEEQLIDLVTNGALASHGCFLRGYSPSLANRIFAAGDFFIIPSRYEPCGLTDYIAQIFGNIPVVNHVGGLVKVIDSETGIAYQGGADELIEAMKKAVVLYQNPAQKREMQKNAIARIQSSYTWKTVMGRYQDLYKQARADRDC